MAKNTYENLLEQSAKKDRSKTIVYVGLSGGVDSSITAYKLIKAGFNVKGIHLYCYENNDPLCKAKTDRADAVKIAGFLNIPIQVWDLQQEYKSKVIKYFFEYYKKGLTPNPDILCNNHIKFGIFHSKALKAGAEYIATGHYAKIIKNSSKTNELYIASGKDKTKDQSYFLCGVPKPALATTLFPLGETIKQKNRDLATKIKLPVAKKKDSTGICFLQGIDTQEFLRTQIKEKTGKVLNKDHEEIGTHKGVSFYTIGQRHGFTINKYVGKPSYVIKKDAKQNTLIVGDKKDLNISKITISSCKFYISKVQLLNLVKTKKLFIRIRNLGNFYTISKIEAINNNKYQIELDKPVNSVAPGQFGVIYLFTKHEQIVIGYGEIR